MLVRDEMASSEDTNACIEHGEHFSWRLSMVYNSYAWHVLDASRIPKTTDSQEWHNTQSKHT